MITKISSLTDAELEYLLTSINSRIDWIKDKAIKWSWEKYSKIRGEWVHTLKNLKEKIEDELYQRKAEYYLSHYPELPDVIKKDKNNKFSVLNKEYYNSLSGAEQEDYVNSKWKEL